MTDIEFLRENVYLKVLWFYEYFICYKRENEKDIIDYLEKNFRCKIGVEYISGDFDTIEGKEDLLREIIKLYDCKIKKRGERGQILNID